MSTMADSLSRFCASTGPQCLQVERRRDPRRLDEAGIWTHVRTGTSSNPDAQSRPKLVRLGLAASRKQAFRLRCHGVSPGHLARARAWSDQRRDVVGALCCAAPAAALARAGGNGAISGPLISMGIWEMYWLYWLFILIPLAAAGGARAIGLSHVRMGDTSAPKLNIGGWLFRQRPEPASGRDRAGSGRRPCRLVLIRRDGVEHLIMTGGPVDVVIETGIQPPHPTTRPGAAPSGLLPSSRASTAQSRPSRQRNETGVFPASILSSSPRCLAAITQRSHLPRLRRRRRAPPAPQPPSVGEAGPAARRLRHRTG